MDDLAGESAANPETALQDGPAATLAASNFQHQNTACAYCIKNQLFWQVPIAGLPLWLIKKVRQSGYLEGQRKDVARTRKTCQLICTAVFSRTGYV